MGTRKKFLNVEEIIDFFDSLEAEDEEVVGVFLEPPDEGDLSGEDSGEENGGFLENLPVRQLSAPCEVVCAGIENDDNELSIPDELLLDIMNNSVENLRTDELDARPSSSVPTSSSSTEPLIPEENIEEPQNIPGIVEMPPPRTEGTPRKIKTRIPRTTTTKKNKPTACKRPPKRQKPSDSLVWVAGEEVPLKPIFPSNDYRDCVDLRPHEQFEKFFDDEVIQMLCDETNAYAVSKSQQNPFINTNEMRVFLGIMIVTGYSTRPSKRDYWSESKDMLNVMISDAMRRTRFETIFRYMHFIDSSKVDSHDKIWKLRPLTDTIKKKCIQNFHPEQDLSYDESMIEYYGRHGCKQFIRGKPLRFGYKMWCLNTPLGYLVNFEMYQGTNPRLNPAYPPKYGKNATPLFCMLDEFSEEVKSLPFCIHFDNLFTTVPVLLGLKERNYHATGTIRQNFIPKSCPLPSKDVLKNEKRGHISSTKLSGADIYFTKWVDNSVVCIASTLYGKNPVSKVGRYSREHHKRIDVPRPCAVARYNLCMGGTDRMDQNSNAHRIAVRGKKWWFCIFTWLVDVAIQNAWLLHRKGGAECSQLQFRREIATYYCETLGQPKLPGGYRRPRTDDENCSPRYDGLHHYVSKIPSDKRWRCRNCSSDGKVSSVKTMCKKCGVGLCIDCFEEYHLIPVKKT